MQLGSLFIAGEVALQTVCLGTWAMVVLKIILGLDWTTWDHGVYVCVGYGFSLSSYDVG